MTTFRPSVQLYAARLETIRGELRLARGDMGSNHEAALERLCEEAAAEALRAVADEIAARFATNNALAATVRDEAVQLIRERANDRTRALIVARLEKMT